jgi:sigma-E factor negative regulatory protein RseA
MDGISALMDGELDEHQAAGVYASVKGDAALRARWDEYHLIGDALRGEPALAPRFNETLRARLAEEPTVLAPRRTFSDSRRLTRYALSAAASVAVVALVAWVAFSPTEPVGRWAGVQVGPGPVAKAPAPAPAPAPVSVQSVPSDGSMNEYLFAHQRFSPSTALQGVAPYIRTVSAERSERR